jgi:gluconate 5-dehydrogenase
MNLLDTFQLNRRHALITGSSGGIGLALARALGQAGAHVILNGRNADKLAVAAQALQAEGLTVSTQAFDVTDASAVSRAVDAIEGGIGAIDILVNNAGMQIRNPLHEFADDDWHTLMKTNLDSVYYVGKSVAKKMIPRGQG